MSEVSPRSTLTATGIEICDRGLVREENQDNVRTDSLKIGNLFIVADGIGGYKGGAIASQMVVDGFHGQLAIKPANYPPEKALQEACDYTNHSIFAKSSSGDPATQRMGSTVVLALIQTSGTVPMAFIGHVGDSRAYLIRGGRMTKITNDHSAVQALLNRNLITEEEAQNHPDSSVLTRSLGHRPEVEIEIDRVQLQAGDALLLCSDGLWGYAAEGDIEAVVTNATLSMETVGESLLRLALNAGGQDNIGIEYIRMSGTAPSISGPLPSAYPVTAASAAHAEAVKKVSRARQLQFTAVALIVLAALGSLGYYAHKRNWFPFGANPKSMRVAIAGDPVPTKPGDPNTSSLDVRHISSNGPTLWSYVRVADKDEAACAAMVTNPKTHVYAETPAMDRVSFLSEMSAQGLEELERLAAKADGFEPLTKEIKTACGDFNVVVVIHKDRTNSNTEPVIPTTTNAGTKSNSSKKNSLPNENPATGTTPGPQQDGTQPGGTNKGKPTAIEIKPGEPKPEAQRQGDTKQGETKTDGQTPAATKPEVPKANDGAQIKPRDDASHVDTSKQRPTTGTKDGKDTAKDPPKDPPKDPHEF